MDKQEFSRIEHMEGMAQRYYEVEELKDRLGGQNAELDQAIQKFEKVVTQIKNYEVISGNEAILNL